MTLVNAEGKEITEPIQVEEAEKLINEATEKTKADYEGKVAELNKKLESNSNAGLRKKTEAVEKEKSDLEKQMETLKGNVAKSLRDSALSRLAKTDDERKKILEAYEKLKPVDPTDAQAVASAMTDAYKLSADSPAGALNAFSGGFGGAVPTQRASEDEVISSEVKDLGRKMGLSDADFSKYGKDIPKEYR